MAPLRVDDDQQTIDRKLEIVGRYTDILLAWRIWNFRATAYSTMQYAMFNVMREIRGLGVQELAKTLRDQLKSGRLSTAMTTSTSTSRTAVNFTRSSPASRTT